MHLQAELAQLTDALNDAEVGLKRLLVPRDEADERDCILEFRAGTGGDEAGLFACKIAVRLQQKAEFPEAMLKGLLHPPFASLFTPFHPQLSSCPCMSTMLRQRGGAGTLFQFPAQR